MPDLSLHYLLRLLSEYLNKVHSAISVLSSRWDELGKLLEYTEKLPITSRNKTGEENKLFTTYI